MGMGRATGKIICGGGLFRDAPLFHELAVCGESLGDVVGGGDMENASRRWEVYAEESLIGSGIYSSYEKNRGNLERANELSQGAGRAGTKAGIAVAAGAVTVGATVAAVGLSAPLAVLTCGSVGAVTAAAATAGVQSVNGEINEGDVVGNALMGGMAGCVAGGLAARSAAVAGAADSQVATTGALGMSRLAGAAKVPLMPINSLTILALTAKPNF